MLLVRLLQLVSSGNAASSLLENLTILSRFLENPTPAQLPNPVALSSSLLHIPALLTTLNQELAYTYNLGPQSIEVVVF